MQAPAVCVWLNASRRWARLQDGARKSGGSWVSGTHAVSLLLAWPIRLRTVPTGRGADLQGLKQLVINLDNGPTCKGRRSQFLQRMTQCSDLTGHCLRLVYYPPYHSKCNAIESYWAGLGKSWNGSVLAQWAMCGRVGSIRRSDHCAGESWRSFCEKSHVFHWRAVDVPLNDARDATSYRVQGQAAYFLDKTGLLRLICMNSLLLNSERLHDHFKMSPIHKYLIST